MPSKQLRKALRVMMEGGDIGLTVYVKDQSGSPVSGAKVNLIEKETYDPTPDPSDVGSIKTTGTNGTVKYSIESGKQFISVTTLPPGYYLDPTARGSPANPVTRTTSLTQISDVSNTINVQKVAAPPPPPTLADLKIQLLEIGTNKAIPAASILINSTSKTTDSNGIATFSLDASKSYTPKITKTGYDLKTAVPPVGLPPRTDPYVFYMAPTLGNIQMFVKDPTGMAIPEIPITIAETGQTVKTDPSGAATFTNMNSSLNYGVNVATPPGATLLSIPPFVNVAGSPYTISMSVPSAPPAPQKATLNLLVKDPTGAPVPGVAVTIMTPEGAPSATRGTTDSSGKLSIGPMAIKPYPVKFVKSGYVTYTAPALTPVDTTTYPIIMAKSSALIDFLIKDKLTGKGIPGVRLSVGSYPSVTTDQNGKASVSVAPDKTYTVDVDPSLVPTTLGSFKGQYGLAVKPGETKTVELIQSELPGVGVTKPEVEVLYSTTGKIVDGDNPVAPINFAGAMMVIVGGAVDPVTGKKNDRLVAMGAGGNRWGPISPDGSFTALYEKKGTFPVETRVSKYKWSTTNLTFSETPSPAKVQIYKIPEQAAPPVTGVKPLIFGCLQGKITDMSSGKPVVGAAITANGTVGSTDTNGNYHIAKIKAGDVLVTVTKAGYKPFERKVSIRAIESANGTPGVGAPTPPTPTAAAPSVTATSPIGTTTAMMSGKQMATTGAFAPAAAAAPGARPGREELMKRATAPACSILNVRLEKIAKEIPRVGTLSGNIIDNDTGAALPNTVVTVVGSIGAITDANGAYSIANLATGDKVVSIAKSGYMSQEKRITIQEGSNTLDVALTATPGGAPPVEQPPYYYPPPEYQAPPTQVEVGAPSVEVGVPIQITAPGAPPAEAPKEAPAYPQLPNPVDLLLAPFRAIQQAMAEFQPPQPPR